MCYFALLKVPPSDWVEPTCAGKRKRAPVEYIDDSDRKLLNPRKKRMISFSRRYYLKQAYRKAMRVAHEKRYAAAGRRKSFIVMRVRRHWRLMADRVAALERHHQLFFAWRENPKQRYIENAREVAGKKSFADYLSMKADWRSYKRPLRDADENSLAAMFERSMNLNVTDAVANNVDIADVELRCPTAIPIPTARVIEADEGYDSMTDRSALSQHDDTAGSADSATSISQNTTDMIKSLRKEATQRQKMKRRRSRQRQPHFNNSSSADYDYDDEPRKRGRFYRQ